MPKNWDETLFHTALMSLRADPSLSHGKAPASILLGRPLVYPFEINKLGRDFNGIKFLFFLSSFLGTEYSKKLGAEFESLRLNNFKKLETKLLKIHVNGKKLKPFNCNDCEATFSTCPNLSPCMDFQNFCV